MPSSRLYTFALVLAASLTSHGFRFSRIQSFLSQIMITKKKTNWLAVFKEVQLTADKIDRLWKTVKFDIAAGYGAISSPAIDASALEPELSTFEVIPRKSPVLWAHQVSKRAVQKAPDKALLGGFVLIASELLRRGVNSEKYPLPPLLREFANTTSTELDSKLEMLSSLEWKADPFLKGEYENLQSQPLEVLDKFIVTSILPAVDKELAPFLLKSMVGDTNQVKVIVQSLKDVIKLSMVLLEKTATGNIQTVAPSLIAPSLLDQTTSTINKTTSTIIDQVDFVGQGIEEVVNDWNRNVIQFAGSITEYLNADSVLTLINRQFQPKYEGNGTSAAVSEMSRVGSWNETISSKGVMEKAANDTPLDIF